MSNSGLIIKPARKGDAYTYNRIASDIDKVECMASFGFTPFEAAKYSIRVSDKSYIVRYNGDLICLAGVTRHSALANSASIWMLTTTHMSKHPLVFMRGARAVIEDLMKGYTRVDNHVDQRNQRMVAALKFLGFQLLEPTPFGILGRPFYYFWREPACA